MELKERVSGIFQNKRVRYGSYSVVMTVVVLAVLFAVNLVVTGLGVKWDVTDDGTYSLTEESLEVLREVDKPVKLYVLFPTGSEIKRYEEVLGQYAKASPHITVEYKDPYLYPTFVNQYAKEGEDIPVNSIIVEVGPDSYKVVSGSELVTYNFDYQTMQNYPQSLELEPLVTGAIRTLTGEGVSVAYTLTGHDEIGVPEALQKQMDREGYELRELNLITNPAVPEDCDILMITTPRRDFTADEVAVIEQYLRASGRLLGVVDFTGVAMPNLQNLWGAYGVQMDQDIIIEHDANFTVQSRPYILFPALQDHEIGNPLKEKGYPVAVSMSQGLSQAAVTKGSVTVYPLLRTSDKAIGKTNPQAQTIEKEEGDLDGPFDVAVAVEDTEIYPETTRLVLVGSSSIMDASMDSQVGGANTDFIMNSLGWLAGKEESIYIRAKSLQTEQLQLNGSQQAFLLLISVILIPLCLLVIGIVRWMRRRHK